MTTEPISKSDEPTTAQKLAQHPRWEWRAGMCALDRFGRSLRLQSDLANEPGLSGWIVGYEASGGRCWESARIAELPVDLADDATAGIVLGMVRAWSDLRGGLVAAGIEANHARVAVTLDDGTGPSWMDETLGDAAGACLLACWARDDAQSTETDRSAQ